MDSVSADRRISHYAARRDGVISRPRLRRFGLTDRQIAWRVRRERLIRLHRGVYLLGGAPLTFRARVRAALLAAGPGAAACRRTALALWGLAPESPHVEIRVYGRNPGRLNGVRVHRTQLVFGADVRTRHGLRCTSPVRTICDLAAVTPRAELEHWIQEAAFRQLITQEELDRAISARRTLPGAPLLRILVAQEAGTGFTRSAAERRLIRLLDQAGLPRPEKNVRIGGFTVDCAWRRERVIVEIDGLSSHGNAVSFHQDRDRDAALTALGWRVLRFTARQLREQPLLVLARLSAVLLAAAA